MHATFLVAFMCACFFLLRRKYTQISDWNGFCHGASYDDVVGMEFKVNPAPDRHRCGICPTYFQKVCAFNFAANTTFIFDNHCVMDLYNCIHGTEFIPLKYENCLYIGNFAYVHGIKSEDLDYEEAHYSIINSKKNPDFI